MSKATRTSLQDYGVALLSSALALLVTFLLWSVIAPGISPFFFAAVMISSWYGGLGPGLLAATLCTLAGAYFFSPLHYTSVTSINEIARPVSFFLVALFISLLNSKRRRIEQLFKKSRSREESVLEFSRQALAEKDLSKLFDLTVRFVAQNLDTRYSAIFEPIQGTDTLLLKSGVGWREGSAGNTILKSKIDTRDGRYNLLSSEPLVIEELRAGTRQIEPFTDHEVKSVLSVIIGSQDEPVGILGVYSGDLRSFSEDDIRALQGVANLLAELVGQKRSEEAVRRQKEYAERLITGSAVGIFSFDRDCRYTFWNSSMESISGIPESVALGRSAFELFPLLKEIGEDRYYFDALQGDEIVDSSNIYAVSISSRERSFEVRYSPLRSESGEVVGGMGVVCDVTEREQAERENLRVVREQIAQTEAETTERRCRVINEVGSELTESIDHQTTLENVAGRIVPQLADWCIIDLLEPDGLIRRLTVVHSNPAGARLSWDIERLFSLDQPIDSCFGPLSVLRTGEAEMEADISDIWLIDAARDEIHLKGLRELQIRSFISVPLLIRNRTLGAITLVSAESKRRYGSIELEMTRDLARQCALSIENTLLHQELDSVRRAVDAKALEPRTILEREMGLESGHDHGQMTLLPPAHIQTTESGLQNNETVNCSLQNPETVASNIDSELSPSQIRCAVANSLQVTE